MKMSWNENKLSEQMTNRKTSRKSKWFIEISYFCEATSQIKYICILLGKLLNMHFYGQADHKKLKYLRQCTDVCVYLFLGTNVGQLTDKSMLTAPTHALNVPGRWGKANWRKLDIVGRYCIAQEGGRFCIVAALNSPWQSKIAFGRIVPRYCWYVCSRGGWWGIQRWAEFSDTRLTDSYAPPPLLSTKSIFQYC